MAKSSKAPAPEAPAPAEPPQAAPAPAPRKDPVRIDPYDGVPMPSRKARIEAPPSPKGRVDEDAVLKALEAGKTREEARQAGLTPSEAGRELAKARVEKKAAEKAQAEAEAAESAAPEKKDTPAAEKPAGEWWKSDEFKKELAVLRRDGLDDARIARMFDSPEEMLAHAGRRRTVQAEIDAAFDRGKRANAESAESGAPDSEAGEPAAAAAPTAPVAGDLLAELKATDSYKALTAEYGDQAGDAVADLVGRATAPLIERAESAAQRAIQASNDMVLGMVGESVRERLGERFPDLPLEDRWAEVTQAANDIAIATGEEGGGITAVRSLLERGFRAVFAADIAKQASAVEAESDRLKDDGQPEPITGTSAPVGPIDKDTKDSMILRALEEGHHRNSPEIQRLKALPVTR